MGFYGAETNDYLLQIDQEASFYNLIHKIYFPEFLTNEKYLFFVTNNLQ